jgi:Tfp pilus assembly protein PilX
MPTEAHRRRWGDDERGASLVIAAILFVVIIAITAVVIDLAAARGDRAANQIAADSAATAAAAELGAIGGGESACAVALDYFEDNTDLGTVTGVNCNLFPTVCDAADASVSSTGTVGNLTVRIVHPVNDSDPLMQSSAIGAPGQTVIADDGHRCGRVGVEITEVHATLFSGIIPRPSLTTSIHAVALYIGDRGNNRAVNLLLLERHECDVLNMSGAAAGKGGIEVSAAIDPVTGETLPGRIAIDSDGTSGCSGNGTVDADGSDAVIQANGPPSCAVELSPAGSGDGCGVIETFAPGPPGCQLPSCSSTGLVAPAPEQVAERLTRAPIDWHYNCKLTYPMSYDIVGCPYTSTNQPYIDQLVTAVGASGIPVGFQSYTAAGHPCNVSGLPGSTVVIPVGNWVVDCDLTINRNLIFHGGNIIFDGNVSLQSDSSLTVNNVNPGTYTWTQGSPLDITESSSDAAFVYLRDGELQKTGQAALTLHHVAMYLASSSSLAVAGGTGEAVWTSPDEGPLANLSLWSESAGDHKFAGQSTLTLDGVFFAPHATIDYTGGGTQHSVAAQFVSRKLHVSGSGVLTLVPTRFGSVLIPPDPSALIR